MNTPELVASILKKGGKCLIVGGVTKDLPRPYQEHPQIIIWDDNIQANNNREVPSNVKVIMWNRWVSHNTAKKLNQAAKDLHAIKFPMLRSREIKELLGEFLQADAVEITNNQLDEEIEQTIKKQDEILTENGTESEPIKEELSEEIMVKVKKKNLKPGILQPFIARNLNLKIDYTKKGTIANEARRIFEIAKKEGVHTTISSLNQYIWGIVRKGTPVPKVGIVNISKPKPVINVDEVDDFAELDRLITDAITAMKLIQEHMPKVKKETEKLRKMKNKVMKLFE